MKITLYTLATASLMFACQPVLAEAMKPKPAGDAAPMMVMDRATFVRVVPSANDFEIRSSELALEKAEASDLKDAAKMIIADHKKAGEKLQAVLKGKGVDLAMPADLSPKHQKMLDQLQAANGKDFDTLYLDMQAQAHMEAIGIFRTYAGSGDDQSVVGFAKETLPSLETHMAHVKMLISAR
ncbi:DUF4142 domain-containing protein [Neorhizobium sp. NPDC001467]|uniref:DUF4142 domain-containing protein n=1 Tax=Neorhizobium sp. NPDC001467 TaxID=3390595 RepID=UPI003D010693